MGMEPLPAHRPTDPVSSTANSRTRPAPPSIAPPGTTSTPPPDARHSSTAPSRHHRRGPCPSREHTLAAFPPGTLPPTGAGVASRR
jgi:hypothetical protein